MLGGPDRPGAELFAEHLAARDLLRVTAGLAARVVGRLLLVEAVRRIGGSEAERIRLSLSLAGFATALGPVAPAWAAAPVEQKWPLRRLELRPPVRRGAVPARLLWCPGEVRRGFAPEKSCSRGRRPRNPAPECAVATTAHLL